MAWARPGRPEKWSNSLLAAQQAANMAAVGSFSLKKSTLDPALRAVHPQASKSRLTRPSSGEA